MSDRLEIESHKGPYEVVLDADKASVLDRMGDYGCLVVDERVRSLYRGDFHQVDPARTLTVEAAEEAKTVAGFKDLTRDLVELDIRRDETVLVAGGGVTQDLAAFTASVLYRGVHWEFLPTTLLAQCDSCIGSKTSINLSGVKNTLGTFHPPSRVYIDPTFLGTLEDEAIRSGIGEMLHYLLLDDLPRARELMGDYDHFIHHPEDLGTHLRKTLEIKKGFVEEDEFDRGIRKILNYGHTFGHALEAVTDHGINHGQAVTVGMDLANHLAVEYGFLDRDAYQTMHGILAPNLPDFGMDQLESDRYMEALSRDKKNTTEGQLTCILPHGLEDVRIEEIPLDRKLEKRIWNHLAGLAR